MIVDDALACPHDSARFGRSIPSPRDSRRKSISLAAIEGCRAQQYAAKVAVSFEPGLRQGRALIWRNRFGADEGDQPLPAVLTQQRGGGAPGVAGADDHDARGTFSHCRRLARLQPCRKPPSHGARRTGVGGGLLVGYAPLADPASTALSSAAAEKWEARMRAVLVTLMAAHAMLLLVHPARPAPPDNADPALAPWFNSLRSPWTNALCCSIARLSSTNSRINGDHYEAFVGGQWRSVPPDAVLRRTDNPNRFVQSSMPGTPSAGIMCFVRGPEKLGRAPRNAKDPRTASRVKRGSDCEELRLRARL